MPVDRKSITKSLLESNTFKIAIFASGNGTNAERIVQHFQDNRSVEVSLILSNKPEAYVLTRAENREIPTMVFGRAELYESNHVVDQLKQKQIDLIVLAGFLWLVPEKLIKVFPGRIINIHPALLPSFGGKGMYGDNVHKAVKASGEKETGITIHYVNQNYDEGQVIFQERCQIGIEDTPETIAAKVHQLEYKHYPEVIERLISKFAKNL